MHRIQVKYTFHLSPGIASGIEINSIDSVIHCYKRERVMFPATCETQNDDQYRNMTRTEKK